MTNTDDTQPSTAHSPEPWHVEPLQADHGGSIAICNREQGILAVIPPLNEDDEPDESTTLRHPCDEANARRICAAVNGCQGISTEALEQGVVRELLEALRDLLGDLTSVQGGVCQHCGRDYIGDFLEGDCPSDDCPSFMARAALAKARPV
jgi:hypothetical protein